ncbi:hypothetical protein BGZ99_000806 [Dissophora globulifera]|uniref:Uncharacterized protein n=1 Tax=Dissophora globulifera TaxID=979702 RepID=A0A9P6RS10_9FUNG|nr:hypothetical protein BGZ99_000806 [Dissophora globulifera]
MDGRLQELYSAFCTAEKAWIRDLSTTTTTTTTTTAALQDCSLHYGEVAFVLAGLKPCVLIQLPTEDLTRSLYHKVLASYWTQLPAYQYHRHQEPGQEREQGQEQAQGHEHGTHHPILGLECRLITHPVRTPEMPLQGCVLLWSHTTVRSHAQAQRIQRGIDLLFHHNTATAAASDQEEVEISDTDLAILLDIPGRLPTTAAEMHRMIEVSYWHTPTLQQQQQQQLSVSHVQPPLPPPPAPSEPTLLTAFAAQPDQIPAIQVHFRRYSDTVRDMFGIQLKLHIQSIADIA